MFSLQLFELLRAVAAMAGARLAVPEAAKRMAIAKVCWPSSHALQRDPRLSSGRCGARPVHRVAFALTLRAVRRARCRGCRRGRPIARPA
jgi:hypothetical protein